MKVITIGRSSQNDITINDETVSRHHVQIVQHDDGHYTLHDLQSKNGTFVNGNMVRGEWNLTESDIVRIGNNTLPWIKYFEEPDGDDHDVEESDNNNDTGGSSDDVDTLDLGHHIPSQITIKRKHLFISAIVFVVILLLLIF